jgi:hypothetical protein
MFLTAPFTLRHICLFLDSQFGVLLFLRPHIGELHLLGLGIGSLAGLLVDLGNGGDWNVLIRSLFPSRHCLPVWPGGGGALLHHWGDLQNEGYEGRVKEEGEEEDGEKWKKGDC